MIGTFRNKQLRLAPDTGKSRIDARMHDRILRRLGALNVAKTTANLDVPGFDFHALKGHEPTRYTIHVNGPWCITFEFEAGDASAVDFEQYH